VANHNPWKARLARYRKQEPGDIESLRRQTWAALMLAYEGCATEDDEARRKALLAYATLAGVYLRTWEVTEIEARILALEQAAERNGQP
jgi:hypothetical protein